MTPAKAPTVTPSAVTPAPAAQTPVKPAVTPPAVTPNPTPTPPVVAAPAAVPTKAVSLLVPPGDTTSPFLTEEDFVTKWLVLGPFTFGENDFGGGQQQAAAKKEFMPNEAALDGTQKGPEGTEWKEKQFTKGTQAGEVNLDAFYNSIDHAAAYAVAWVIAPADMTNVKMLVGSDDYITVWLNGKQVLSYDKERRGSDWDQDKATGLTLNKGVNRIVVKCVDVVSDYNFYLRLATKDDMPIAVKAPK